jgi:hypothetical protein
LPLIELSEFADFGQAKAGLAVLTAGVGEQSNAGGSITNLLVKGRNSGEVLYGIRKLGQVGERIYLLVDFGSLANSPGDGIRARADGS